MKKIKVECELNIYQEEQLDTSELELIAKAKDMVRKAYAVYSGFQVGCALRLASGEIITGNNQENASYPAGICAERVALSYANANFPDIPVVSLAIVAYTNGAYTTLPVTPCGICRQVLLECEARFNQAIKIYMYGQNGIHVIDSSRKLLPFSFDKNFLPEK
ncbi:MAG: cytidine deaminase [Candidatus Azobacteroides sp.]|nr:cytidine deaminase [Candidatus Azobacteroides sp.]